MSRSPRTVTQTSTTAPPAWLQTQQQDFLSRANAQSNQAYTPYTAPLVAGMTGDQTQARDHLRDRIAAGGSQGMRDGRTALNQIIGGGSYTAPGQISAGTNDYLGRATSFDPRNPMAGQRASVGSNAYMGRETEVARNRFLDENNPFLQGVIDNTTADVTRAFNQQQAPQQLAQFAMGGAFGGSAHLQAMGESQRALAQELGRTAGGLRSEDFNARRQLAESEAGRITDTRLADVGRNADLSQRGLELQANLDNDSIGRDADIFQRGNEFGANIRQNDLSRNADIAGQDIRNRMDADTGNRDSEQRAREFANSQRLSALSQLPGFEDMGIRDIEALNRMGSEERDYLQQLLTSQYGQFLDQRDWDTNRLGIYGNALGQVAPNYQNSSSTGANPNYQSRGQQILGGGMALLGLGI